MGRECAGKCRGPVRGCIVVSYRHGVVTNTRPSQRKVSMQNMPGEMMRGQSEAEYYSFSATVVWFVALNGTARLD